MPMRLVMDRARPVTSTGGPSSLVAADLGTPPRGEGAPTEPIPGRRFHAVAIVEAVWTGDGRFFEQGSVTWRDLPLPLLATDKSPHGPGDVEPAITIGSIDTVERRSNEIHVWGAYVQSSDPEVTRLQNLIFEGHLRGVSIDGDDPEYEVIIPAEMMAEPTLDEDGDLVMSGAFPRQVFSHVRMMGLTVVPFPAVEEAFIEDDDAALLAALGAEHGVTGWVTPPRPAVVAGGAVAAPERPLTSPLGEIPLIPPPGFFDELALEGPTPLTVLASGELYGHLALWGTCHIGSPPGECITPPTSATNYAHFLLGEIVCSDGSRVACGKITMGTGHADLALTAGAPAPVWHVDAAPLALTASAAAAHYDNTGTVVAHVTCGEDEWGIWLHGAVMPGLSPAQLRVLMGSDLSGDWRRVGNNLELVAMLAVNVPGFPKPRIGASARNTGRCRVRSHNGQVASLVACLPVDTASTVLAASAADAIIERIAATIGRSPRQRIEALRNRVHGGK